MVVVSAAVEGPVDEAVVRRLIAEVGGSPGKVFGKTGKSSLKNRIKSYNDAARFQPWFVLVDLDQDADCAPNLCRQWLPRISARLCFRVAVREVEAWLLADREQIAKFLSVSKASVPNDPESERDPKQIMVNLASRSRSREIREDMVPRPGSGRAIGPAYTSRLIEFVSSAKAQWQPEAAAERSSSLRRCLECLRRLIQTEHNNKQDSGFA